MKDAFFIAVNTQKNTYDWMSLISENMSNMYTPGYRATKGSFANILDGSGVQEGKITTFQGKSFPGTSTENVYLEGDGFFVTKNQDGKTLYTRLGEFTFNGEGVYKSKEGYSVQGYMLNDKGEILSNKSLTGADNSDLMSLPTSEIKLWRDPNNGKYLGKYEEFEIKGDGIIYGKTDEGKTKVPLYKIAAHNFNNPGSLSQVGDVYFAESKESGKPVMARGEIRSGLIELSNVNMRDETVYLQQAKMQMEMTNKLISTTKTLLQEAIGLLQ